MRNGPERARSSLFTRVRSIRSSWPNKRFPFCVPGSAVVRAVFTTGHETVSGVCVMQGIRSVAGLSGRTLACRLHSALRPGLLHLGCVPDAPDTPGHVPDQENNQHDDEQGCKEAERSWSHRRRVQTRFQCRVTRRRRRCGQAEGREHTHHFRSFPTDQGLIASCNSTRDRNSRRGSGPAWLDQAAPTSVVATERPVPASWTARAMLKESDQRADDFVG